MENQNTEVQIVGGKMPSGKPDPKILSKSGVREPTKVKIQSKHKEDIDETPDADEGHTAA